VCRAGLALVLLLGSAGAAAVGLSPQELVRDTSSRMLVAMRDEQQAIATDADRVYELVAEIVLPYFDFQRMGQWVLGRNWRAATQAQREQFVEQFRILLVRTYGTALSGYADEKIVYLPFVEPEYAATVTVRTEIEQTGAPIPISYSMYRSPAGWKVYDVAISGVSLVTNYRSSFGSIIRKEGMDALIRQLTDRNSGVSGG